MITVENLSSLGPALKELRNNVRMTQGEVCALAGLKASQLSRWENGHERPTLESVVKVLGVLGRDLADLQAILAGTYHERLEATSEQKLDEHGKQVRAAYLDALRARRAVAKLATEGVLPLEDRYMAADRAERLALLELLTAASGQFVDPQEGYFAHLSIQELWAHFRILEGRFQSWVTEDAGEAVASLAVPRGEERWGVEVRGVGAGGRSADALLAEEVRDLRRRLGVVEERVADLE